MPKPHTLIIHKFNNLFNILDEIKNILNFDVVSDNNDKVSYIEENKNILVISGKDKLILPNQIVIKEYPINITKLIEIVNIHFLKNKFNQQNNINIGKYYININSRVIGFDKKILQLTEKEIKIIHYLSKSKSSIKTKELQSKVWGFKYNLETHTVETHIHRLRKKIYDNFKDKNFIISSNMGYKLNEEWRFNNSEKVFLCTRKFTKQNLDHAQKLFEEKYTVSFVDMYQFWVKKI